MSGLISIIIPVYNTGTYLTRCVQSILVQDYPEIEIILVDDGSTDLSTCSICDELANNNESIRVFHKSNGGSASARNYGIKKAKGKFLGFVDSDDVIDPKMYSSLLSDLQSNNVKIALGNIATEEDGRLIDKREALPSGVYYNTELLHYFCLGHWHSACTNLYARSLFDNTLFPEGEVNEDYMLNYWLFKEQPKVYFNSTAYYHYVRREGSNTSSPVTLAFLDWIKHTSIIREELSAREDLKEEADYQYLYSNIILGNKCLLSLGKKESVDADKLYTLVARNLKTERKKVFRNRFLSARYRSFGLLLSCTPRLYKCLAKPLIRAIK